MKFQNSTAQKILRFLASLKLAVIVLLAIAVLTAVGTFVEAYYDAYAAAKLVYKTWWMYLVMTVLVVNLTAVMVDRWPWKRRHTAFVCAHIGIIILLFGALITQKFGLDGNMRIEIGKSSRYVSVPETDFAIHASYDGVKYTEMINREVDFFSQSPAKNPISLALPEGELKVIDYKPYMMASPKIKKSENTKSGAAIRFQLESDRINANEWLLQKKQGEVATHNFGPAQIHLGELPKLGSGKNEIWLRPLKDNAVEYVLFKKESNSPALKGTLKEGENFITPWMNVKFNLLRFYPLAEEVWEYKELERPTSVSTSAIRVSFLGKEHWIQLNDVVKLFSDRAVYLVVYANRRIDLGFDMHLENFEVGRYQGTQRAATYQSVVRVGNNPEQKVISMNEPLKYAGFTFYQASFQDGPNGPIASMLSVNQDPGRWLKYLGSFLMSLGVVLLFWFKKIGLK